MRVFTTKLSGFFGKRNTFISLSKPLGDEPYYLTEEEAFFSGKPKGKSSGQILGPVNLVKEATVCNRELFDSSHLELLTVCGYE